MDPGSSWHDAVPATPEDLERVALEQVALCYRNGIRSMVARLLVLPVFVALLWALTSPVLMVLWLAVILAVFLGFTGPGDARRPRGSWRADHRV